MLLRSQQSSRQGSDKMGLAESGETAWSSATMVMPLPSSSPLAADTGEVLEDVQQSLSAAVCVMHDMTLFECLDEDLFDLDPEMVPVLEVVQQSVRPF